MKTTKTRKEQWPEYAPVLIRRRRLQCLTGWVFAVLMLVNQCFTGVFAQQLPDDIDFDPPVIDHEAVLDGVAGEPQVFSALVIDDRGIEHVLFYHRRSSNSEYTSAPMKLVPDTSSYMVSIETPEDQRQIEYYIEALDTGGNRVLKGFPFYPLVRELNSPAPTAEVATIQQPAPQPAGQPATTNKTWLYVLLGILAVGVVASLNAGDDGPGVNPPSDDEVPLTIIVSPP